MTPPIVSVEMNILHLQNIAIYDQLLLEEQLLREDARNFCLINTGSTPAIVMGISGKEGALVHLDQLPSSIPIYGNDQQQPWDRNEQFLQLLRKHKFGWLLRWQQFRRLQPNAVQSKSEFLGGLEQCFNFNFRKQQL